jgi:hypothetical protein
MYVLAEGKCETGLFGGLCKVLVTDREITDAEDVLGNVALHGASAILYGEVGAIGLVGGGSTGLMLGLNEARNICALGAGDPEVARPNG